MRTVLVLLIASITVIVVSSVNAEDSPELPPEGAWARYHVLTKPDNGEEAVFKSTLKFLGRQEHKGTPCRWLEITERDQAGSPQFHEFLVPERALQESPNPFTETVLAHYRLDDGEIQPEGLARVGFFGTYLLFLPTVRKEAKPVDEPQSIDVQQGRLVIPTGHRGEFRWSREAITVKQTQSWIWDYTIWLDPKLPVGIARGRFQLRYERDGEKIRTWTQDLFVEDFGLDAKSAFPK